MLSWARVWQLFKDGCIILSSIFFFEITPQQVKKCKKKPLRYPQIAVPSWFCHTHHTSAGDGSFAWLKNPYPGHYLVGNGLGTGFWYLKIPGTHFWEKRNGLGTHFLVTRNWTEYSILGDNYCEKIWFFLHFWATSIQKIKCSTIEYCSVRFMLSYMNISFLVTQSL